MRALCFLVLIAALTIGSAPARAAWQYDARTDPMGGSIRSASTVSSNTISFSSPYAGPQRARLHLRAHPRHGRDVILVIERGQFMCSTSGCSVLVRFDEKPAFRVSAAEPADHSSTALFLESYDRIVKEIRAGKIMRIEALFFHQGSRVIEFDISNLDTSRLGGATASQSKKSEAAKATEDDAARREQQNRMIACNAHVSAAGWKGELRREGMSSCLQNGPVRDAAWCTASAEARGFQMAQKSDYIEDCLAGRR